MSYNKNKVDVSEVPTNKEIEEWKSIAVSMGISYRQLTARAVRRYVADYKQHMESSVIDFLDDRQPYIREESHPLSQWLMEKAEFASARFTYYLREIELLSAEGVDIDEDVKELVIEGGEVLEMLTVGVPDLMRFSVLVIDLHEIGIALEYFIFSDDSVEEEDKRTSKMRTNLEALLKLDIDKETMDG